MTNFLLLPALQFNMTKGHEVAVVEFHDASKPPWKSSFLLGQKDSKRNLGFPALLSSNEKPKDNGQSHVNLHFAKNNLRKDASRT
jgi:hypothetical protein